jgi:hypothetical protein
MSRYDVDSDDPDWADEYDEFSGMGSLGLMATKGLSNSFNSFNSFASPPFSKLAGPYTKGIGAPQQPGPGGYTMWVTDPNNPRSIIKVPAAPDAYGNLQPLGVDASNALGPSASASGNAGNLGQERPVSTISPTLIVGGIAAVLVIALLKGSSK